MEILRLTTLFADFNGVAYETGQLAAIMFVPAILAAVIFFFGLKMQFAGKPTWIKWLALVPLAFGVYKGIEPTQLYFTDPIYSGMNSGTWKKALMHCGGIWMGLLAAIGLFLWNQWAKRQNFEDL